ncbi:MAG: hypothetical protein SFY96_01810 [Planctomycetota bacterium]|nr:hypothetical protein [Planctomycetota bacterium]
MSQLTADSAGSMSSPRQAEFPDMRPDNIYLPNGGASGLSTMLLIVGVVGLAAVAAAGFAGLGVADKGYAVKHALAAYHVGTLTVLTMGLGGLFFTLAFHLIGAGWSATIRRQFENLAALLPLAVLMMIPTMVIEVMGNGHLFSWMNPKFADATLLKEKASYLNTPFFVVRFVVYGVIWTLLSVLMNGYSRKQDVTGDRWLTAKAAKWAAPGMVVFALSVAFASFDFLMALDFRFFSTMWGVYIFAGSAFSSLAVMALVFAWLKGKGLLKGVVTEEHFHDLGKLLFSFTVFWSYIAFSQYFLIWYSNIPEETAFYLFRKSGNVGEISYNTMFVLLCLGHFGVPFLFFIWRKAKRTPGLAATMALWMIFIHIIDLTWLVRPMVFADAGPEIVQPGVEAWWIPIAGVLGPVGVAGFFLLRRMASGPLVPLQDPRLHEALHHKNYV